MRDSAITGKGAMKQKPSEAPRGDAKQARDPKPRDKGEKDAVARAVLEALSAHDL
jgi:hypothetical protein